MQTFFRSSENSLVCARIRVEGEGGGSSIFRIKVKPAKNE